MLLPPSYPHSPPSGGGPVPCCTLRCYTPSPLLQGALINGFYGDGTKELPLPVRPASKRGMGAHRERGGVGETT